MSSLFRSPSGKNNSGGGSGKPSKDKDSGSRNPLRRKDKDGRSWRDRRHDREEDKLDRRDRGDRLKRRKFGEPLPQYGPEDFPDGGPDAETKRSKRKRERTDRKRDKNRRKQDGPAVVEVDDDGNATTSGGGKKNRKNRKNKRRDQQSSVNKAAQQAEESSSIGGMDDDEPPSARHANAGQKRSEPDVHNGKGPRVVSVDTGAADVDASERTEPAPEAAAAKDNAEQQQAANELDERRRRRQQDREDSPSSQDTAGPQGNEGEEMTDSANPYSKIPDPSSPQALKETLMGASNAAMQDAGFYEDRAEKNRAEARNLEDKGDVFSEAQQDFLRRAAEDDETASNRRGQAAVYAEQSQNVRV